MRIYEEGKTTTLDEHGYNRFWSKPFSFGKWKVLISKEWYSNHFDSFDAWYNKLNK